MTNQEITSLAQQNATQAVKQIVRLGGKHEAAYNPETGELHIYNRHIGVRLDKTERAALVAFLLEIGQQ